MTATGSWNVTMNIPQGAQQATLDLVEEGATLTGSMSSPALPEPAPLSDGTVDGDALAWKVAMTSPMAMTLEFTATVAGDAISGTAKLGTYGDATFEGARS